MLRCRCHMNVVTKTYLMGNKSILLHTINKNNTTLKEATYIFIMCYVHILQYGTAKILGNATQSGLHGFSQATAVVLWCETQYRAQEVQNTSLASTRSMNTLSTTSVNSEHS